MVDRLSLLRVDYISFRGHTGLQFRCRSDVEHIRYWSIREGRV